MLPCILFIVYIIDLINIDNFKEHYSITKVKNCCLAPLC